MKNLENMSEIMPEIPEAEIPADLHGKIMKRVFFAGYGRYLYLSTGVLFLNLGVLVRELWRTVAVLRTPDALRSLSETLDLNLLARVSGELPIHVFIILGITTVATAYALIMIWKLYREYRVFVTVK